MEVRIEKLHSGFLLTEQSSEPMRIRKYGRRDPKEVIDLIRDIFGICPDIEHTKYPGTSQITQTKVPNILKKDILIPKFKYDHSLRKQIPGHENIWYAELPDGRVALRYGESSYYTTKENVMNIPFPVPYGYFKESGVSTLALTCFRAYRNFLSADKNLTRNGMEESVYSTPKEEHSGTSLEKHKGDENGSCDDVTFDSCANNSPENCKYCVNESRFEDKRKIAANKPSRPLLKATVGI